MLDNGVCVDVAVSLAGLRWEMPCASEPKQVCSAKVSKPTFTTTIGGVTGRLYAVTLWFRGVVEQQSYRDGVADGMWYVGGASANGAYNIYKLEVSDPPQTFFLNAGRAGVHQVWALDYQKTIKVRANATLTLSADAQDGSLIGNFDANGKPIVVTGVPPAPQPFNGQFIQMDVVSVTPAD